VGARTLALLLRPSAPPLMVGVAVSAAFITAETLLSFVVRRLAPGSACGALFLFGVLVISAGWGIRLAVATSLASAATYVHFHMETNGGVLPAHAEDVVALTIFLPLAFLINVLVGQARLRTIEARQGRRTADLVAGQQTALRRVATLVARGSGPEDVYPAAVTELAGGLGIDHVALLRYCDDAAPVVLASRDPAGAPKLAVGEHFWMDGSSVVSQVAETGAPARIDDYAEVDGGAAARVRAIGIRSAVGAPITVDGRLRGILVAGSTQPRAFGPETEAHIRDFADLVVTAISNAETRAALTASRARIVTAADQARRGFERDLHDGAQQRVVSLGLAVRAVEASVPVDQPTLRRDIARLAAGLSALSTELQDVSRGIHPAILSKGGLGPALRSLARRCPIPVDLDVDISGSVPESIGVAAYYVVAEALTNAAKHAAASGVDVRAVTEGDELALSISDDGIGGATTGAGSGLTGLTDRVEALSGQLTVASPRGIGTTLTARIPLTCAHRGGTADPVPPRTRTAPRSPQLAG
jgi:signal transduction histidine kinase